MNRLILPTLAVVLIALPVEAQPGRDRPRWDRSGAGRLMEEVCASSRRCAQGRSAEQLVKEVLDLPMLTEGRTPRDALTLRRLQGDPMAQLEYALKRTAEQLAGTRRYERMSRNEHMKVIAEELVIEYNSGYWSTLPDDLRWFDRARHEGPDSSTSQHVEISHFSLDVSNSWLNGNSPLFLLEASLSITNGPPAHFQMWCEECESITPVSAWQPWEDWNSFVVVRGEGYKNICLQVRAEPYQGNFANTTIACYAMGEPPVPEPPVVTVAPSQNPVQRCFGAIGNHCGPADEEGLDYGHCIRLHPISDPDTATCQINAGSWEHDECCIEKRVGGNAPASEQGSCSPHMAALLGQPYVCQAEFNIAVAHLAMGFTWTRDVDASIENTTGVVEFLSYCAPTGTVLQFDGVERYCCSRTGQPWVQHAGDLVGLRWICL